jgi:hypothetical protein
MGKKLILYIQFLYALNNTYLAESNDCQKNSHQMTMSVTTKRLGATGLISGFFTIFLMKSKFKKATNSIGIFFHRSPITNHLILLGLITTGHTAYSFCHNFLYENKKTLKEMVDETAKAKKNPYKRTNNPHCVIKNFNNL